MKLEIHPKQGRMHVLSLLVEGEEWRQLHTSIFGHTPKLPELDPLIEWTEVFLAWEYKRVRYYILKRLASQNYHSQQLKRMLKERFVSGQTINRVLTECQDSGYLNDEEWITSFIRIHQKKNSRRTLLMKLQAKGFSREQLQDIESQWVGSVDETQSLEYLLKTKYRSKDLSDRNQRQKVIASLMRKGYPFEQIKSALSPKE